MVINPNEFYSLLEVQKITGIKSRQILARYVREGKLTAFTTGKKGTVHMRYGIKGDALSRFLEAYKSGDFKKEEYAKKELKMILDKAIEYCKTNNIKTVEELVKSNK